MEKFCAVAVSELNFLVENPDLHIGHHLDTTAMEFVMSVVKEATMQETVKDLDEDLDHSDKGLEVIPEAALQVAALSEVMDQEADLDPETASSFVKESSMTLFCHQLECQIQGSRYVPQGRKCGGSNNKHGGHYENNRHHPYKRDQDDKNNDYSGKSSRYGNGNYNKNRVIPQNLRMKTFLPVASVFDFTHMLCV